MAVGVQRDGDTGVAEPLADHLLRRAVRRLQAGVDITVMAPWLGHEDTATTHLYVEADLAMKQSALDRIDDPGGKPTRFTPPTIS